jgi:hypothetical protein
MKMSEFLALSDDDKVTAFGACEDTDEQVTEDKGVCSQCGGEATAGDFCFGCHKLICSKCLEKEPHFSECLNKPVQERR